MALVAGFLGDAALQMEAFLWSFWKEIDFCSGRTAVIDTAVADKVHSTCLFRCKPHCLQRGLLPSVFS